MIGGFVNAKRSDLQAELRSFFEQHGGPEVLKEVFVPYLRSNIARLELNFPGEADLRQRRLIQTQVLEVLKTNYTRSTILDRKIIISGYSVIAPPRTDK